MSKKLIISIIIIALIAIGAYFGLRKDPAPEYEFITAEKGNIIQEVDVTGRVKPNSEVALAFEKSGKINFVGGKVGDQVYAGETLVQLENADLQAQLAQAEASVKIQQAKLDELKKGTRPEEIQIQEAKVEQAKTTLDEAKKNIIDKIQDAYTKADDAVRNKVDQLFNNPKSSDPQVNFVMTDSQLEADIEWKKLVIENTFTIWKASLGELEKTNNLTEYAQAAKDNLDEVKSFLDKVSLAVNVLNTSSGLSQTTIDGYKTDISTARTNINTAITNLSTAEESLSSAGSSLAVAENELTLKKAGTVAEQILAQEAQLEEAQANVQNYQAQIEKTTLRSPIYGIVTQQDAKVGEIVSAGSAVVSIISNNNFKVESNIPEADIAKVKVGNKADITLDAYEDDVIFEATVTAIEPAETIVEGVATYKTTFNFVKKDSRIKPGMTADINIKTAVKENVIAIPQRAVMPVESGKIVRIINPNFDPKKDTESFLEVQVKTGLRGSDGRIEILEGINEGDKVITFLNEK